MSAPAYQTLADDIRAEITSGRLRPGDRLPTEPELCAQSGHSRSTVREALRLLASQHLIVTTRGVTGGSFVAHPSPDMLVDTLSTGVRLLITDATVSASDMIEVRQMLEVPAAGLAAVRRTPVDLEALRQALFDPVADSLDRILAAHREFHEALATCTANALYQVITVPLYSVANERELADLAPPDFWFKVDFDHREILRCVAAGDAPGAQLATAEHLRHIQSVFAPERRSHVRG